MSKSVGDPTQQTLKRAQPITTQIKVLVQGTKTDGNTSNYPSPLNMESTFHMRLSFWGFGSPRRRPFGMGRTSGYRVGLADGSGQCSFPQIYCTINRASYSLHLVDTKSREKSDTLRANEPVTPKTQVFRAVVAVMERQSDPVRGGTQQSWRSRSLYG